MYQTRDKAICTFKNEINEEKKKMNPTNIASIKGTKIKTQHMKLTQNHIYTQR